MGKNIGVEAVDYFEKQFKEDIFTENYNMLDCLPHLVTEQQNVELAKVPDLNDVKRVVSLMNGDSASGPDDFSGVFFINIARI